MEKILWKILGPNLTSFLITPGMLPWCLCHVQKKQAQSVWKAWTSQKGYEVITIAALLNRVWSRYWERCANRTDVDGEVYLTLNGLSAIETVRHSKKLWHQKEQLLTKAASKNKRTCHSLLFYETRGKGWKIVFAVREIFWVCPPWQSLWWSPWWALLPRVGQRQSGNMATPIHKGTQGFFSSIRSRTQRQNTLRSGRETLNHLIHYLYGCFKRFRSASHVPSELQQDLLFAAESAPDPWYTGDLRKPMRASRDAAG